MRRTESPENVEESGGSTEEASDAEDDLHVVAGRAVGSSRAMRAESHVVCCIEKQSISIGLVSKSVF